MPDLVFLDTETHGLHKYAPIWEVAAVRRNADGTREELHMFVKHDRNNVHLASLPSQFSDDYYARYDDDAALTVYDAACNIKEFCHSRPTLIGAVPSFDAERISRQFLEPLGIAEPWHYHLIDVENIVVGYLAASGELSPPPWSSDELSKAVGVCAEDYPRHTAMGDVRWTMAQWDAVFGDR